MAPDRLGFLWICVIRGPFNPYLELFLISLWADAYCLVMRRQSAMQSYDETISRRGFRFTRQRREVYDALLAQRDHPTAVEVFMRVKARMPSISLATVYNCLETLTECALVKHVSLDRAPTRYCPNLVDHGHFFCEECGGVFDVPLKKHRNIQQAWELPARCTVSHHEVTFRGVCPACASQKPKRNHRV